MGQEATDQGRAKMELRYLSVKMVLASLFSSSGVTAWPFGNMQHGGVLQRDSLLVQVQAGPGALGKPDTMKLPSQRLVVASAAQPVPREAEGAADV